MSVSDPFVVEVERSGLIESVHPVDVAVADADGLVFRAGDADVVAYLRSSAKPLQALACLDSGWRPSGSEQLAVACASHNGEPEHVAAVRATLSEAGISEDALGCPAARPFLPEHAASGTSPIFHNCSGKHAAMLATARANDWPLDGYREPDHPIQRAIATLLEQLAGRPARRVGIDGCGVPTFAFRLSESAAAFARFPADGSEPLRAMAEHPFLVAGTGRLCTAVLTELPDVAVKIGAEGIACGVIRDRGIGFALKARDGTQRARDSATVSLLEQLTGGVPQGVAKIGNPDVAGGGRSVGSVRCRGALEQA